MDRDLRLNRDQPCRLSSVRVRLCLFVCLCAEFAPEMQSGLRDHISKSDRLSVTKPRSRAQSERGIPYYNYSVSPSMLEDLTRVGRSPKPLIPARVSLPGLRGRGRGPCESSVDPPLLYIYLIQGREKEVRGYLPTVTLGCLLAILGNRAELDPSQCDPPLSQHPCSGPGEHICLKWSALLHEVAVLCSGSDARISWCERRYGSFIASAGLGASQRKNGLLLHSQRLFQTVKR